MIIGVADEVTAQGPAKLHAMTNARPAPCFITIYTPDGTLNTSTEELVPESEKDMTDPKTVSAALSSRLSNYGFIRFSNGQSIETVYAVAVHRINVQAESDIGPQVY